MGSRQGLVNAVALLWGGAMLVNMAWPRAATNPRPATEAPALNFHWHWLNSQPVLWTVLGVIVIVGAVYYVLVQSTLVVVSDSRTRPDQDQPLGSRRSHQEGQKVAR